MNVNKALLQQAQDLAAKSAPAADIPEDVKVALGEVALTYGLGKAYKAITKHIQASQQANAAMARDAELIEFLDTVFIEVHVRDGRRYTAGPGFARHIIESAKAYQDAAIAATHSESGQGDGNG